jgi:hypothetical protein
MTSLASTIWPTSTLVWYVSSFFSSFYPFSLFLLPRSLPSFLLFTCM